MKKSLLVIILLLALLAAGCQAAGLGGGSATNTPAAPTPDGAYPGPGAYPPVNGAAAQGASLYPWYIDGTEVGWEQVIAMLMNGEVSKVIQSHDLKVTLTLKDGRTLATTEPAIDEIMNVIQSCGDPCKDIQIATE